MHSIWRLATAAEFGELVGPINLPLAVTLYRKVANCIPLDDAERHFIIEAKYTLGDSYENGDPLGCTINLEAAAYYYKEAAKLGDSYCQHRLALAYICGPRPGEQYYLQFQEDLPRALSLLEEAAAGGECDAMYVLSRGLRGCFYLGCPIDESRGLQLCSTAASLGCIQAQLDMVVLLSNESSGFPMDLPRAIAILEQAAADGNGQAIRYMAQDLELGPNGLFKFNRDLPRALLLYEQAAALGDPEAHLRLAKAFYYGQLDCATDLAKSKEFYVKSVHVENRLGCPSRHPLLPWPASQPFTRTYCNLCAISVTKVGSARTCFPCSHSLCTPCFDFWSKHIHEEAVSTLDSVPSNIPYSDQGSTPGLGPVRTWALREISLPLNCPAFCGLFKGAIPLDRYTCDVCFSSMPRGADTLACRICDFDVCSSCQSTPPNHSRFTLKVAVQANLMRNFLVTHAPADDNEASSDEGEDCIQDEECDGSEPDEEEYYDEDAFDFGDGGAKRQKRNVGEDEGSGSDDVNDEVNDDNESIRCDDDEHDCDGDDCDSSY